MKKGILNRLQHRAGLLMLCLALLTGTAAAISDGSQQDTEAQPDADVQTQMEDLVPEDPEITRGILAAILYDGDDTEAMQWAQKQGLFLEEGAATDPVTREQAAYAMMRQRFLTNWPELIYEPVRYGDHMQISSKYATAVYTAQQAGLLPYGGLLHPKEILTRSEWTSWEELEEPEYVRRTVRLVSHRGYHEDAPENTLAAFRLSAWNGFRIVECDVQFTKDGVPVLMHDSTVDRTSNGSGKLSDMTLAQVRKLDFGSWKGSEWKGTRIPTFAEFISLCSQYHLTPYVEIKGSLSRAQAKQLFRICAIYGVEPDWISFNEKALWQLSEVDPDARIGLLSSRQITNQTIEALSSLQNGRNEVFLGIDSDKLTDRGCYQIRIRGMAVEAYGVKWEINDLRRLGVSGFTTDQLTPRLLAVSRE
ncbi:MAG: glycerophosphodiester phosphodiesterase [Butyricicoccaceae bacterium]